MFESLVLFSTGLIGFFTVLLILFRYKSNNITNIYLIFLFAIMSLRFLVIGIFSIVDSNYLNYILKNFNNSLIVIIPFTYLYFKSLVFEKKSVHYFDLFHIIFPVAFIVVDVLDDQFYIQIPFKNRLYFIIFALYTLFYLFLDYRVLNKNVWKRTGKIELVVKQNKRLKSWTLFLFSLLVIMTLRLLISLFLEVITNQYTYGSSYLWMSGVVWLSIFLRILIFPEILYGYTYLLKKIEEEKKSNVAINSFWKNNNDVKISNVQDLHLHDKIKGSIILYMENIDRSIVNEHYFRNSKFTLGDLANKLNIPKSHISYLFKYHSEISFSDFKKIIRIKDGLSLIETEYLKINTFDSLAKEVGFASYNTFFTSFKDVTGVTPQEYNISQDKIKE
jgi:AraC-like DNA-binding protein